ncbi:unnamed protein product [Dovyalis caffra]|uniref:Uncharacterized protein n=1 Tax=Dovyalis caffra TaxID=77055 RepID=A0AAV1RHP6_9ROSI|nr:unnamed protein product [Dovyalis caffra]
MKDINEAFEIQGNSNDSNDEDMPDFNEELDFMIKRQRVKQKLLVAIQTLILRKNRFLLYKKVASRSPTMVKEGERIVVVATNVDEISLNIPGINYAKRKTNEDQSPYGPASELELGGGAEAANVGFCRRFCTGQRKVMFHYLLDRIEMKCVHPLSVSYPQAKPDAGKW